MTPEAIDALTRLKTGIKDKGAVYTRERTVLTVSTVEVNPRDIVDLCNALPPSPKTQALQSGSANALLLNPEIPYVGLHVVDVAYLIREAEALTPAAPPTPAMPDPKPEETPAASVKVASPPIETPATATASVSQDPKIEEKPAPKARPIGLQ